MTTKRVKENQVAYCVALVGITTTTIGHYIDGFWVLGYAVAIMFGILAGAVFVEE